MKGSEFAASIKDVQGAARESAVLQAFQARHLPPWFTTQSWPEVDVEADIKGRTYRLKFFVAPDYFSIGNDDNDFLRMPARPSTYQTIGHAISAILPSRRMVNAIWGTAATKGALCNPNGAPPPSLSLILPPAEGADRKDSAPFSVVNDRINQQLKKLGKWPTNSLIAGDKKDVVIGPDLDGTKVAIYGWHQVDGKPIQPFPGPHNVEHVDYSHGGRFVSRVALLDGSPIDIASIFTDKDLHVLVSDQGPFPPFFPNTGEKYAMEIERALAVGRDFDDVRADKPISVDPVKKGWGTLEWLTAIATSLSIGGFVYDRFYKPRMVAKR